MMISNWPCSKFGWFHVKLTSWMINGRYHPGQFRRATGKTGLMRLQDLASVGFRNNRHSRYLSYEKNFVFDIGGDKLPSYMGIIINHEIRIPIKQPGFNGK